MKGPHNYFHHNKFSNYHKSQSVHKEYDHAVCNQYLLTFLNSFNNYNKSPPHMQESPVSDYFRAKNKTPRTGRKLRVMHCKSDWVDKENLEPLRPNHDLNELWKMISNEDLKIKVTLEQPRRRPNYCSRRKSSISSAKDLYRSPSIEIQQPLDSNINGLELNEKTFSDRTDVSTCSESLRMLNSFELNDSILSQGQINDTSDYEKPNYLDQDLTNSQPNSILLEEKEETDEELEDNKKGLIGLTEVLHVNGIHGVSVLAFAVTSDNNYIISGFQRSIRVFNVNTQEIEHEFKDVHQEAVRIVLITSNDRYIISASNDRSIKIFNLLTKEEVHHFQNVHNDYITSIALSPDNQKLISASRDRSINIFDLTTMEKEYEILDAHKSEVKVVTITKDNQYIVSGSLNGSIKVFDLATCRPVATFPNIHESAIYGIAVTSDSKYIVSVSFDRSVNVIDLPNRKLIHQYGRVHEDLISCVAITADDRYIITASFDKSIKIIDLETKKVVLYLKRAQNDVITSMVLSQDNNYLYAGSMDSSVKMFKISR